jgi:hypothetical protein
MITIQMAPSNIGTLFEAWCILVVSSEFDLDRFHSNN